MFTRFKLVGLIVLTSIIIGNSVFAVEIITPHSFVNEEQVSLMQVNDNFDRLYESANSWLPIFVQEEIIRAHTFVAGQPANADHLNANFAQLLLSFNVLLSELQQPEILKLNQLYNGRAANASEVNQNFNRLFSAANTVYATYLNTQYDPLYQKVNSSLSVFGQNFIAKPHTFEPDQSIIADQINANFDALLVAYNSLLLELQQNTIVKPYTFVSGQNIAANQLKQNFQILFDSAELVFSLMTDSRVIPDTGQSTCYDQAGIAIICPVSNQALAQDGSYNTFNQLNYSDNGDGTITDIVTGLTWQKTDDGVYRTWSNAVEYCNTNAAGLPGSRWRLPNVDELLSIVDFGTYDPASDPLFNSRSSVYWTFTADAVLSDRAWRTRFLDGHTNSTPKTQNSYVRCVQSEL